MASSLRVGSDQSQELSLAAKRVFVSGDPYQPEFTRASEARTLLAPTNLSMLDRTQFYAIGQGHAVEGGGPVYAIPLPNYEFDFSLGTADPLGPESGFYAIDFRDPQTYFSDDVRAYMAIESLIVPTSGRWGVLVAEHFHAVVAGSRRFVDAVLSHCTLDPDEMALLLVRRWKELGEIGLPSPWLPGLLESMYGPDKAAAFAAHDPA